MTLRWRAHQSPYVIRSEPPGWSVCITLTGPRIPLPGPPRQGRGQSCPWLRVPGPPTARFAAWRLPAPDARTSEGRTPMAEPLGTFRTAAAARACCQADATSRAARRDLTESIEADEHG